MIDICVEFYYISINCGPVLYVTVLIVTVLYDENVRRILIISSSDEIDATNVRE